MSLLLIAAALLIVFIIYILSIIAVTLASIAGTCGVAYGGGLAVRNYGRAFHKNVIASNSH